MANLIRWRILRATYYCTGLPFAPFNCCKGLLPPPTCMCVLMRSSGAEMVFDTAADRPPATQCRDQYSNSVRLRPTAFSPFNDVFSKHWCMPVHMACRTYSFYQCSKATGRCRYRTKNKTLLLSWATNIWASAFSGVTTSRCIKAHFII